MSMPREAIGVIADALDVVASTMVASGYPESGDVAVLRRMAAARRAEADIGRVSASGGYLPSVVANTLRAAGIGDGMITIAEFDAKAAASGMDMTSRIQAKRVLASAGRLNV